VLAVLLAVSACRLVDQRTFESKPATPAAAALARPELPKLPVLTITFASADDDWRPSVHEAVRAALAHKPDASFAVVTPVPTARSHEAQDAFTRQGREDATQVAREVQASGVNPDHVSIGLQGDPGSPRREVRIYAQ
jgi:hypothetical protein